MKSPQRILVLDGQTNQALACVRSLGRAGQSVLVASHLRWPLAAWSRFCEKSFRFHRQTIDEFASIRAWAVRNGVTMVLPLSERSCLLCNLEREAWEAGGITVGCGPDEMLRNAFDKARTLQLAAECGVSIPPTVFPQSFDECLEAGRRVGYPCVVKPRFSHAWDGARFLPDRGCAYVNDLEALREAAANFRQGELWPLIQGYVPGTGKGVFALCDRGRVVAWFAHERLRDVRPTGSGSSLRRSVQLEARLRAPSEHLLEKLNWHGPAMVEYRDDGVGEPVLMEVNGRFWNSLQLAVEAGIDFPFKWVSILNNEKVESSVNYQSNVTLRWLWGDVKRFCYILKGRPKGYTGLYPNVRQGLAELFGAQPEGTHLEVWQASDPWPAVGEWVQGVRELLK